MIYSNKQMFSNPYGNPAFGSNAFQYGASSKKQDNSTIFGGGLTENETKALTDCYVSSPSESLPAAAWGGVTFALMNNPRFVVHPYNSIVANKPTKEMFKSVMTEGSTLNKLWTNPETNEAMRDAYSEMERAFARGEWKVGAFRRRYSKETVDQLKGIMEQALKDVEGKSPEEARKIITTATKTLESAYITDGPLRFFARPLSRISGGSQSKTVAEGIANTAFINENTSKALEHKGTTLKSFLKTHAGLGGIALFTGFEFIAGLGNIKKAFAKDKENAENGVKTNYGMRQLGQTTIKGLGSGIGWGIGEALGNWAFAKKGLKLGTKFNPAIGTVAGGVIGLVGASIGMMITGRLTKKMVGEDIGAKIEAKELMQTPEGQAQVLENVYEKVKKGEATPEAAAAMRKFVELAQLQAQAAPQAISPRMNIHA